MVDNFDFEMEQEMEQDISEPSEPIQRTRAQRRKNSVAKAMRKRRIDMAKAPFGEPMYNNLHQFSKNKIHCSCVLCRRKSSDRGAMSKKHCPTAADIRKLNKMDNSYREDFLLEKTA